MKRLNETKRNSYKEQIVKIGRLLNEKKLRESTFGELVEPAKQVLNTITAVSEDIPEIPYNELISVDSNLELDVSEKDLTQNGTLTESVKRKRVMQEAVGASNAVREFIQQGGEKDYEAFKTFCVEEGFDINFDQYKKGSFNFKYEELYSRLAAKGNLRGATDVPPKQVEISKNLENFIALTNTGTEFVETAIDTVRAKYKAIAIKLKRVIMGKSLKNYYLLMGDAGIGKSYIVREMLKKTGKSDVPMVTGSLGTSQSAVAMFLWQNRNKELVILDDCDTMIKSNVSADVSNMLKGAMDPDKHHVHISTTIRINADRLMRASMSEEEIEKMTAEEELGVLEGEEGEVPADTSEDGGDLLLPNDWNFNARVVFISNLTEGEVNAAVLSRCDYYELHLTQEEYMVRLGEVIANIDCGQGEIYTDEDVKDAKALLMTVLSAIIEAGNKGVKIFNRTVHLRKGGLEFRLVKDLVESFLALVEYEVDENPDENLDDLKKRCAQEWIRTTVIPRITA